MYRFLTIQKGDTPQKRQAKRSFKRTQRAKRVSDALRSVKQFHSNGPHRGVSVPGRPYRLGGKKRDKQNNLKASRKYKGPVEWFCQVNNMEHWTKARQRKIDLSPDFSLYENPDKVLKSLLHLLYDAKVYREYPMLEYKGKLCFGALYLMDNICWEIARHRQWQLKLSNMPPAEQEKLAKLRSFETSAYESDTACMLNEAVFINRKAGMSAQTYKRKSAELRQLIEKAIGETTGQSFQLPQEANTAIYSVIGEQFDNVLEHVPNATTAQLCCFYDRITQELTILIYNFGPTIAEKMKGSNLPPEVAEPLKEIIATYTARHWFRTSRAGRAFNEENALTLLALQEGISSRLKYDITRGFGLLDYIEYCFALSPHCRISLISGTTAININNKYPVSVRDILGRKRRVLALNPTNDLMLKPDPAHLRTLSVKFPGVIFETTIPLAA